MITCPSLQYYRWIIGLNRKKLENYLSIFELELTVYEDVTAKTYISFLIYQDQTVDPMLFCADIGAPHSCIGDKELERIVCHSVRRSIPIIDSESDFKFGDTLIRPRGMVELMLPTSGSTLGIPVILDVIGFEISPLLGLNVLDWNNFRVDIVTNHLWSGIITNKDLLRFEDIWKIKLIRRDGHLYVPLTTPI